MQGCEQRYPYPRRECGPCLSSPVRLRPCCEGSLSVSQNKTVLGRAAASRLPIHDTFRSSGRLPSPPHPHWSRLVDLTNLEATCGICPLLFSRSFFNSGCTGFTLRARSSIPSSDQHLQPPHTIAAIRPRCTQNPVTPRILYATRPRPCNLRADHCLSLVLILGRLVPRQRLFRLTAAVPSTCSRRATLISQCLHHG